MLNARDAHTLLATASSLDGLTAIGHAVGCTGRRDFIRADQLPPFGIDDATADAAIIHGPGALRVLAVVNRDARPLRDVVARVATRLCASPSPTLWLLIATSGTGELAIAAWHPSSGKRSAPRIAALVAKRDRLVDSDADTLRAIAAGAAADDDLATHARWVDVLGREAMSRRFFRTLSGLVGDLAESSTVGGADARSELALLCTSRLLFLAFLESKGWLDDDRAFLSRHFDECMRRGGGFHARVLRPLFFGTLNTPTAQRADRARRFGAIPFLNGGLFTPTILEKRYRSLQFSDEAIGALFGDLFSAYRFTAREDRGTFEEAAVDPEMLGRAFESLMASRERQATGAFYTPHALVERVTAAGLETALSATVGRDLAMRVVADECLNQKQRVPALEALASLRILDPACGSGAFLVHALERVTRLRQASGDARPVDAIRRDVIATSIFGVDVNPTAVWLCGLRLWLAVVIDSTARIADVRPLPNLDRNVRVGDSLAGRAFAVETLPSAGATRIGALRARYARSTGARKLALAKRLDTAERRAAIDALDAQIAATRVARLDVLDVRRSRDLFGERGSSERELRVRADDLRRLSRSLRATRARLAKGGSLPFEFGSAFADVAAEGGFSLIVGNPPWVRPHRLSITERSIYRRSYAVARPVVSEESQGARGFGTQFDLAALFVERSLTLIAPNRAVAMLLPAKLWRSLSGAALRDLVTTTTHIHRLEDHSDGDASSAFDASVYPGVLVVSKRADPGPRGEIVAAPDVRITVTRAHQRGVSWCAPPSSLVVNASRGAQWLLLPPPARHAFDLLRDAGEAFAHSRFGMPRLGVKCGVNEAFLVSVTNTDSGIADVHGVGGRRASIEDELLRPVIRGEDVVAGSVAAANRKIIWTHSPTGEPRAQLPPLGLRWMSAHRPALLARADARTARRWWSLFRTEAARCDKPRVVWADVGRSPRAAVLRAGDDTVPLNSCYVTMCSDMGEATALMHLLNSRVSAAWLAVVAEQARGGYRRYLGWTMGMLPLPRDWERARGILASLDQHDDPDDVVCALYGLRWSEIAPLIAWTHD